MSYALANREIKRLTAIIGKSFTHCTERATVRDHDGILKDLPFTSHLKEAYAPQEEDNGNGHMRRCWHPDDVKLEILEACPACLAAHKAIQERKILRQQLGAAKRRITCIGKALL